jgi:Uma2 family endonuclease
MSTRTARTPRRATYEDLIAVPDHMVAEILDGELVVSPRPAPRHANAASVIGMDVGGAFHRRTGSPGGPGGWWILDEPELHLGDDVLVPDLAGWRRSRLPSLPETAWFSLPPDWVCEVLSPKTARIDRVRKMRILAREQVRHVWLVDPIAQVVEVFRFEAGHYVLLANFEGEETFRAEPFEDQSYDLRRWWPEGDGPVGAEE